MEPGVHVTPELSGWFQQVLACTSAAGLIAFAGDGNSTAPYLTTREGSRRFSAGIVHAATDSVQDSAFTLLGIPFVGTDHVSASTEHVWRHSPESKPTSSAT